MKTYVALAMAVLLLSPVAANAQRRRGLDRDRIRDARSERIAGVIRDCEDRTDEFLRAVERAWGTERHVGDQLDRDASRLERAMNRIRDSWNRDRDYNRTRGLVGTATGAGRDINRTLHRHRIAPRVEREWGAIRDELNQLAEIFDQPKIRWDYDRR
jgi:hypothetical protein